MMGEVAALLAAMVWAVATWIYGQFSHRFSSLQLNLIKGLVASLLMAITLALTGSLQQLALIESAHFWVLVASGVIGIAIGDSAYFASLQRIGPNKTLLLESLAPPLSGVLALMALGTQLPWISWLGVVVTTFAVTLVVFEPHRDESGPSKGVLYGLLASVCQATGVVISHYALVSGDLNPLAGAFIRLTAGTLVVWFTVRFYKKQRMRTLYSRFRAMETTQKGYLFAAIVIGTFIALWLQQVALKLASPAVAQTLIATSPVFILAISAWRGKSVSLRQMVGTAGAMLGVLMFFVQ